MPEPEKHDEECELDDVFFTCGCAQRLEEERLRNTRFGRMNLHRGTPQ